jgi:hypothetical protein
MIDKDQLEAIINEVDYDREVETKTPTKSTTTRHTKIRKATGQMSTAQARDRNDPLYKRMIRYREMYYKYRDLVHRKYRPGIKARARR